MGHQQSGHHPFLEWSCDPLGRACTTIYPDGWKKCAEWKSFRKRAKVSNRSSDTANVPGLPAVMFNQRLNTHCITFPSLARRQLPHPSPLFQGNIDCRGPLRSGLTMFISFRYLFFFLPVALGDLCTSFFGNSKFPFICNSYSLHCTGNHEAITGPHAVWAPIQTGDSYANLVWEVKPLGLMHWKHLNFKLISHSL